MILNAGHVIVGRNERAKDGTERFLVDHLSLVFAQAHERLRTRVIGRSETWWGARGSNLDRDRASDEEVFWDDWNVAACVGDWGRWETYVLLFLPELGIHPTPAVRTQWAFRLDRQEIEPMPVPTGPRAPVLHLTTRILDPDNWPIPNIKESLAHRAYEGLMSAERLLEHLSLSARPDTQTAGGVRRVLEREGISLVLPPAEGGAHRQFRTYELQQRPAPGQIRLPGLLTQIQKEGESISDNPQSWSTLEEALSERV